ncbi:MAG: hypothetical protein M0C28_16950 [Candidatus Moduliflexus flocculans]|nr:hypothetical protein [Candidatus Moduliflexus flocculans]
MLGRLDPHNAKWKQRQIEKVLEVPDSTTEKLIADIEEAFVQNELDYGRKLYLIENCIFGVDIQPIAVQIAKLRFFISLLADQKSDPEKENLGVRPLPNLETRFVAANTLIGLEKPKVLHLSVNIPLIERKEQELKRVRKRHFTARTQQTKNRWREEDSRLRAEIAALLQEEGWDNEVARRLALGDP